MRLPACKAPARAHRWRSVGGDAAPRPRRIRTTHPNGHRHRPQDPGGRSVDRRHHDRRRTAGADPGHPGRRRLGRALDIFKVSEALGRRGWYLDRQNNPDSLHATVSNGNAPVADEFLTDLADAVAETLGTTTDDRDTAYATVD